MSFFAKAFWMAHPFCFYERQKIMMIREWKGKSWTEQFMKALLQAVMLVRK